MEQTLNEKRILVTGSAGFIGANVVKKLLVSTKGSVIVGLDNCNNYYDVRLKEYRLAELNRIRHNNRYIFIKCDITDRIFLSSIFEEYRFDYVIHLAAQAGVRYSITNPDVYLQSNVIGFYNVLELCRCFPVKHLIYASSSSVYGDNHKIPFSTDDKVDDPASFYAATKKADELFAHAYSKLYGIPSTGLRFFTVYGPCGRPDMAYFLFANKLIRGEKIELFNYGHCARDFTYIDDVVEGIVRVIRAVPKARPDREDVSLDVLHHVYNLGHGEPVNLLDFVNTLAEELIRANVLPETFDIRQHQVLIPMQNGDVPITFADVSEFQQAFGFQPKTSIREGLHVFSKWFYNFYVKSRT